MTDEQPPAAEPGSISVAENVVTGSGELDFVAAPALRAALEAARGKPRRPVLDLTAVTYLDSATISIVFEHADHLELRLAPNSLLNRVLSLTGVLSLPGVEVTIKPPSDSAS